MSAFTVHTTIEGNLTADVIVRTTANGLVVGNMRVAVTSRSVQPDGNVNERTEFVPVVLWRDLATNAAASLRKGSRVIVTGDIKQRNYTNKEGNEVYVSELHADGLGVSLRWHVVAGVEKAREALAAPATDAAGPFEDELVPA